LETTIYAERANYWKTSKSSPDSWLEKTIGLVEQFGGEVIASGFGNEHMAGRAAYMIRFSVCGEAFRLIWPVLPSETGDTFSARRQAATMMYHAVKSRCVEAQAIGARIAFFAWLELPDGRAAFQLANNQLLDESPKMLLPYQPDGQ
jgi:hypothetical protein